jgi:hypothetical protein
MSGLEPVQSASTSSPEKAGRGEVRRIGDVWQWLGTSGPAAGTSGAGWRVFGYTTALTAAIVSIIDVLNVITRQHDEPQWGLAGPIVWEATSWVALMAFVWIPWIGYRLAPPFERPRWRMLVVHPAGALLFGICHVATFVLLRKLIYWAAGANYDFGAVVPNFLYEFSKDWMGYAMQVCGFALFARLMRPVAVALSSSEATFTIKDGTRILRVPVREILAVSSAGNYVEFVLRDGRRPLMRSPLSQIETEFTPRGFVRVHRSWLVNRAALTGLRPDGSGDYTVEIGELTVPLSRRFPDALASLKSS